MFFSRLKVREKILAVTAIPLAIIIVMGGMMIWTNISVVRETTHLNALSDLAVSLSSLVHELQKERGASAVNIGTKGKFANELGNQRDETDGPFEALAETIDAFDTSYYGQGFALKLTGVEERLSKLASVRRQVASLSTTVPKMAKYYTTTIGSMLGVIESMNELSTDAALTRQIAVYLAILHEKERAGQERAVGAGAFGAGKFSSAAYNKFVGLIGKQEAFHKTYLGYASPEQIATYKNTMDAPETKEVQRLRNIALTSHDTQSLEGITGPYWYKSITKKINLLKKVEDVIADELKALAISKKDQAYINLALVGIVCLVVVAASVLLTIVMVTRTIKPVHAIAAEFGYLANYDLTRKVQVHSSDEIGEMSDKFNQLVSQLAAIVTTVRQAGTQMAAASEELSSTMREMSEMGETQSRSSIQISEAVRDSSTTIQEISNLADSTQKNVENISNSASNATECMEQLHQNTTRITNVLNVIRDITDQVNLLALNAAIEAARAGDAGRGFAVVADEVRKLASHTTNSTKDIENAIADLQEDVKNTGQAIQVITEALKNISTEVKGITSSLSQQSATIEEISSTAVSFSSQTEQMGRSINETEEVSRNIANEATELDRRVQEFKL